MGMDMNNLNLNDLNNIIECNFDYKAEKKLLINIRGSNNLIKIDSLPILTGNLSINIHANNCVVHLGKNIVVQKNVFISLLPSGKGKQSNDLTCTIGDNVIFNGAVSITLAEQGNSVLIGRDSLFANNVTLSTSDSHMIFCCENGGRVNPAQDISIGERVWLCEDVKILKGANIPNGCVCGTGSIISQKFFEENSILAGVPAKIVRRNIYWER